MVPTATSERDWLVSALLGAPAWPAAPSADQSNQADRLLTAARKARVAALVYHTLHCLPCWGDLPEPLRQGLRRDDQQAMAWEIASRHILCQALDALAADGIPFLLLKGLGLAHLLYPEPHHRTREDTDLLVADREMADRLFHTLKELGYRRHLAVEGRFVSYQFTCFKPGPNNTVLALDVHWRLSNSNFFGQKFDFDRLWAERRPIAALGPDAATLSERHALIHALFHRAWHLGEGETDRLLWLYDMHLLCAAFGPTAWAGFVEEVDRCGLQPICRDGLQATSATFGTWVPPEVVAALSVNESTGLFQQLDLKRPGIHQHLTDLMSLPTWGDRLGLIRELLFPDPAYMRQRFGVDTRRQLPLAYLSRAAKGLRRRLRRR
jgi:hypothetical protein